MSKNIYFERYAYPKTHISTPPSTNLGIIVTIPCFNEPDLISSLNSLYQCNLPKCHVEVIVVINNGENAVDAIVKQNLISFEQANSWAIEKNTDNLLFQIILANDLPKKHAGVGLARKIAMDEAVRRFESLGNKRGIIACYDADSLCEKNYLTSLEDHFRAHPQTAGCSIYFEHPLKGDLEPSNYDAIIDYELFLRYYTNALKLAGLPYAFQTVGSSMAVRSDAYQQQGGMNKRHAGEDFYFLHKIIALGNFTELNNTKVIPSPRQSDRVPFGTGKAVKDWLETKSLATYNPQIFIELKQFISLIEQFYSLNFDEVQNLINECSSAIQRFLIENDFEYHLAEIKTKSGNYSVYKNHFFKWFNAFKVLKFVHFSRDNYYPNIPVLDAVEWLLSINNFPLTHNAKEALLTLRLIDNPNRL